MSALSTPAFLVDEGGVLVFYNEAAGILLGKRFEELGTVGAAGVGRAVRPLRRATASRSPTTSCRWSRAVRDGRPAHAEFTVRSTDGAEHEVEASAFPILTAHGSQGAIASSGRLAGDDGNGAGPA